MRTRAKKDGLSVHAIAGTEIVLFGLDLPKSKAAKLLGFGFERLDPIGKVRDSEAGKAIDGQGDLNDLEGFGSNTHAPFSSMQELGGVLASSKSAEACLVRQMYRFARGQLDDDVCMVTPIAAKLREKNGDIRELMIAIVTDPAFVERR